MGPAARCRPLPQLSPSLAEPLRRKGEFLALCGALSADKFHRLGGRLSLTLSTCRRFAGWYRAACNLRRLGIFETLRSSYRALAKLAQVARAQRESFRTIAQPVAVRSIHAQSTCSKLWTADRRLRSRVHAVTCSPLLPPQSANDCCGTTVAPTTRPC